MVQNSRLESPQKSQLDQMAGVTRQRHLAHQFLTRARSRRRSPPWASRYLFGDETIHVRARIDLIDWHGISHS